MKLNLVELSIVSEAFIRLQYIHMWLMRHTLLKTDYYEDWQ